MNIQNVQIQAFLERIQSKIMRKIEDEYYCGGYLFESQQQLDQFKQVWLQKLKQQFVIQNQQQLSKDVNLLPQELPTKLKRKNDKQQSELEINPRKSIKKEEFNADLQESNLSKIEASVNIKEKEDIQINAISHNNNEVNSSQKKEDGEKEEEERKQKDGELDDIDYMKILEKSKFKKNLTMGDDDEDDNDDDVDSNGENKIDQQNDFSLNSDDLDDVSDQIIEEGYFNDFDNYLIGYIGKERKTKKKCKEQNKPLTSIDFQCLIGNVNKQEIIISSLRASFVDCRK